MAGLAELWDAEQARRAEAAGPAITRLAERFVIPPFTVLNTRAGDWQERRRAWLSLGIRSELGRGAALISQGGLAAAEAASRDPEYLARTARKVADGNGLVQGGKGEGLTAAWVRDKIQPRVAMEAQNQPGYRYHERDRARVFAEDMIRGPRDERAGFSQRSSDGKDDATIEAEYQGGGTSIFDPVLAELAYRWWCPLGGHVLDPFAGGSVRGIVAAMLGHPYTGVDLSAPQIAANVEQREAILAPELPQPAWHHGDSRELGRILAGQGPYDMVFTCPPYFDLEVYSDDPADLSNAPNYAEFIVGYRWIIEQAAELLAPDRFMVIVVGEIRDSAGLSRNFVGDTIEAARAAGLGLYNDAVLVNSAGSAPLRVTKYMEASRKLARVHQSVLCFVKGRPPRDWSYDRPAPPSPQLALALDVTDAPGAPEAVSVPDEPAPEPQTAPEPAPVALASEDEAVWIDPDAPLPAWQRQPDGRWLDTATGELRSGCYTCGRPPDREYRDGSPAYDCDHPPIAAGQATLFSDQEGTT